MVVAVVVAVVVILVVTNQPGSRAPGATTSPSASPTTTASQDPEPEVGPSESVAPGEPNARETTAPVELDGEQAPLAGVSVRLVSIESVEGEAVLPGEVAGPALRVTVEASNSTGERVETPAVVVNLYYGPERVAGNPFIQPGGKPFPPSIPAGGKSQGVFIFDVPKSQRDDLIIEVDLLFESAVVLFEGAFTG
ncbi:MAG TPA: hypothetical protein PK020_18240 [Ilumatobacteraceae bacterium]|nr:hypothetical protein [Ilumatobacteraceae bacterium]